MLICRHVRDVDIRPMQPGDLGPVVDLQVRFLHGSLLTDLGSAFLTGFYTAALGEPRTRALVAVTDGGIAGAAVASTDVRQFNAHVKPRIVIPLAAAVCDPRRWRLVPALLESLREPPPTPAIPAELLTLVVDGTQRQRGIGRALIESLEQTFAAEQVDVYRVAVRSHLDIARAFYEATGFAFEQELTVLGRPMTYLTKRVNVSRPRPRSSS